MWIDGIDMVFEVVMVICDIIKDCYGDDYILKLFWMYKNKVKNVQEVYECICLMDMNKDVSQIKVSEFDQCKFYDLIWKCIIVCQMEVVWLECIMVDIVFDDGQVELCVIGQVVMFDGFMKVYEEGCDDV